MLLLLLLHTDHREQNVLERDELKRHGLAVVLLAAVQHGSCSETRRGAEQKHISERE